MNNQLIDVDCYQPGFSNDTLGVKIYSSFM
jgi:hypothetical protein